MIPPPWCGFPGPAGPCPGPHLIEEGQQVLFPDGPSDIDEQQREDPTGEQTPEYADEAPDGETVEDRTQRQHRPKAPARKTDTSGLPREERQHELMPEQRFCPETGLPLVAVGEKTFDEIDYVRARLVLVHHRQIVYDLAPEQAAERSVATLTAPLPSRPLEGCAASANLVARILVQKYSSHLPLHRQEAIFARDGLRLPHQTLCTRQ